MHRRRFTRVRPARGFSTPRRSRPARRREAGRRFADRAYAVPATDKRQEAGGEECQPDLRWPEGSLRSQTALLGGTGAEWSAQLPALGEVLTVSRNAHAVLAEYGVYPAWNPHAPVGADGENSGRIFPDFTRWTRAVAREEPLGEAAADGTRQSLFNLTFQDPDGHSFQSVCLLPGSNLEHFQRLARGGPFAGAVPDPGSKAGEIAALQRDRLRALRERAAGKTGCRCGRVGCIDRLRPFKLPPADLPLILERVAARGLPLWVSLLQPAIVHTARFTPWSGRERCECHETRGGGDWRFVHDERVGLHLNLDGIAALWFTMPEAGKDGTSCLEAYDAEGQLLLAFAAANPPEDEWLWRASVWSH